MHGGLGKSVCGVGAGAFGLLGLENLRKEGCEATACERNGHIGGLWHMSEDTIQTTVLRSTIANISKDSASADIPQCGITR